MVTSEESNSLPDRQTANDLLYRSLQAVYHFERSLVDRFGLGYQEICLLQLLRRRESARVGEIATALGVRVFSATRLVQRLEASGYLGKEPDERDGRVVVVRLLGPGERLVSDVEAYNFERIVGRTSSLPPAARDAFVIVADNLERVLGVEDRIAHDPR